MQFKFDIKKVSLSQINTDEETYRITTHRETSVPLTSTVDALGILRPPVLKETATSEFVVIAGFRRIAAATALGWRDISAGILPPDTSDLESSILAIADNSLERSLDLIELARSFSLLNQYTVTQDEVRHFATALNLPYNPGYYKKLRAIAQLPQTIQEGIVNDDIALPSALLLVKMKSTDAIAFSDLFKQLNLSTNKQRELIVISTEIALRENLTASDVITTGEIQDTLSNPDFDPPQKAKRIREYLKTRRFPNLSSALHQFANVASSLALNPNLKLIPPPDFEGNKFSLTLSFKDPKELAKLQSSISELLQNSKFINYFKAR